MSRQGAKSVGDSGNVAGQITENWNAIIASIRCSGPVIQTLWSEIKWCAIAGRRSRRSIIPDAESSAGHRPGWGELVEKLARPGSEYKRGVSRALDANVRLRRITRSPLHMARLKQILADNLKHEPGAQLFREVQIHCFV